LLNTSFNLGGEPIVETVGGAIRTFNRLPFNAMALGRFILVKRLSPDVEDLPIPSNLDELALEIHQGGVVTPLAATGFAWNLIRQLQATTRSVVFVRTELPLYDQYLEWLRDGRKVTTIRFRRGAVEIPSDTRLPLFETKDFSPGDRSTPADTVQIHGVRYRVFGELTDEDARRDGFEGLDDMRTALGRIYPTLAADDWVSVYDISLG
jgi:hypothetical protein